MNKEFKLRKTIEVIYDILKSGNPTLTIKVVDNDKIYIRTDCKEFEEWIVCFEDGTLKLQCLTNEEYYAFYDDEKNGYFEILDIFPYFNKYKKPLTLEMNELFKVIENSELFSNIEKPIVFNVNHIQFYSDENYDVIDVVEDNVNDIIKFVVNNQFVFECEIMNTAYDMFAKFYLYYINLNKKD